MAVSSDQLGVIMIEVAERLEFAAPELRALDAELGDGDLGLTVTLGMRAIRRTVSELERTEPATLIAESGKAFANANPSTMGALVGAGLSGASDVVRGRQELDAADFAVMARRAYEAIRKRGKAELGQKTLLDALAPSVIALEKCIESGRSPLETAAAMRLAAEEGAASSDKLQAEIGRASWLHERSRGKRDPGAQCWLLVTQALEEIVGAQG